MNINTKTLTLSFFIILLTGCDSPKDANENNFRNVINEKLNKNCISFSPTGSVSLNNGYPLEIPLIESDSFTSEEEAIKENNKRLLRPNALVAAGILSVQDKQKKNYRNQTINIKEYNLTDEGRKYIKSPSSQLFCVGNYQVDEIIDFTEPTDAMGVKMTLVNYTISPKNLPDWANKEPVKNQFNELQDNQKKKIRLILKNNGWSTDK